MDAPPQDLGPFTARQLLATGASSTVWLADGPDGEVAIKVARNASQQPGLAREAELLGRLDHPNLVRMVTADPDGRWIALERINGQLMDDWSRNQSADAIVRVAFQLVSALEHLHALDVVHGDLKPSNVLIDTDGHPRLLDLGVATLSGDASDGFRGTLGYAAPEQLRGERPSRATDIYGLGALLYTCITGRTPFVAPDPAALTYLPLVSLPPPPASFRTDIPASINQLLLALLAREPSRRPSDLGRVKDALTRTLTRMAEPILGMHDEREDLRRAVVGVADGEARVVVIYGPPGSGRRTLIGEAVEYARREGLPYVKGSDLSAAVKTIRQTHRSSVMVQRAVNKGARQLARLVLAEHLPCLLLLHADNPVPELAELGAIQLTPAPFSLKDVSTLATILGVDASPAEAWWRETHGLPIAVLGRIHMARRKRHGLPFDPQSLPSESRKILRLVTGRGPIPVAEVARELGIRPHVILDHCEVLFAEGVLASSADGASLQVTP